MQRLQATVHEYAEWKEAVNRNLVLHLSLAFVWEWPEFLASSVWMGDEACAPVVLSKV